MTANLAGLIPHALVLIDTAPEPQRGIVVRLTQMENNRRALAGLCRAGLHTMPPYDGTERKCRDCRREYDQRRYAASKANAHADAGYVTTAVALLLSVVGSLIFLAVLGAGQRGMCHLHHDQLRYCPGYSATHDVQETTR